MTGANEGARGDGNGGEGPALVRTHAAMTTKSAMFRETPLTLWGRRCRTGRMKRRERRQTTPNAFTNERRRRTGGNGVTRGP